MNTNKWTSQIDQITTDFKQSFGMLSPQKLNWKPNPKTWSIAQNIEHLIVTNQTYYPIVEAVRKGRYQLPFIANFNFIVNLFGKIILDAVQPDRKRKIGTFPLWQPSQGVEIADIFEKFEKHQTELKNLIVSCQDLLEKGTIIGSPANKNLVYKLETAFDIIVAHEKRHFEQAKEVLALMK